MTDAQHEGAWTLDLSSVNRHDLPLVGGKGANLGELLQAGFAVPPGFCVTTTAFSHFIAVQPDMEQQYTRLATLDTGDLDGVRQRGEAIRALLRATPMPPGIERSIKERWQEHGTDVAYGVRSSATAEDLPDASFAGQQDTYLNVRGETAILTAVRDCWASLFTDRAILYRMEQGFSHRDVRLAVVVQRMVDADIAGIMFTAEPITGNRTVVSIDASYGLGEALVSGIVSADLYQVDTRTHHIVKRQIAEKEMMIRPLPSGGVEHVTLEGAARSCQVLSDDLIVELSGIGTQIAEHYGVPQDIEWAREGNRWYVLQARPITSLFPVPQPTPSDDALYVYFSFSHFQVMTDPMPPLVLSLWRTLLPIDKPSGEIESRSMAFAAGRLYADISPVARHPVVGKVVPRLLGNADHLAALAMKQVIDRPTFKHGPMIDPRSLVCFVGPVLRGALRKLLWGSLDGEAKRGQRLMDRYVAEADALLRATPFGIKRLRVAVALIEDIMPFVLRTWFSTAVAGIVSTALAARLAQSVGTAEDAAAIGRGFSNNVTTEMDLAVGDLGDIARQHTPLHAHLRRTDLGATERIERVPSLEGGMAFMKAWQDFMNRYGARAPSEIDLSRPRWTEDPTSLLQMVLNAAPHDTVGAHRTHFARLAAEGDDAATRVVASARRGPLGWIRAPLVERVLRVSRTLGGTRELHKLWLVRVLALIKPVFEQAGDDLAAQGRIADAADVWFLTLPELLGAFDAGQTGTLQARVAERRAAFGRAWHLVPPRVITSDGEIPTVDYDIDVPAGALAGSPVSAGVVEGTAHVIRDPQTEHLMAGEILVAPFTDPGWTPLFINAAGLVVEVGGLMTHGSVIAREYGIPAVVGVPDATHRIQTGQRVRVNGTAGYVEIIDELPTE